MMDKKIIKKGRLHNMSATVRYVDDGYLLVSYHTSVAFINNAMDTITLYKYWDTSPTTIKHVKEFITDAFVCCEPSMRQLNDAIKTGNLWHINVETDYSIGFMARKLEVGEYSKEGNK